MTEPSGLKICQTGNSLRILIPDWIIKQAGWQPGDLLQLTERNLARLSAATPQGDMLPGPMAKGYNKDRAAKARDRDLKRKPKIREAL